MAIHHWLDATKEHFADFRHRTLRHHDVGVVEAVKLFGPQIRLSDGNSVDVRSVCEAHIEEDCGGKIPSIQDWFDNLEPQSWMPGSTPMTVSLDNFVKKWGGIPADYQPLVDWFEWAPVTYSDLALKGYRYHAQGVFEAERTFGYTMTNSNGRVVPVRYIAEQHIKLHCCGRIPSVGDWLSCIIPATWMSRGYRTRAFEHAVDLNHLMSMLHDRAFDFTNLELTDEHMPDDFHESVLKLRRPYARISELDYRQIFDLTEGRGDIVKLHDIKMTLGHADGGWALMPLDAEYQDVTFY
jgi:hypothetical protein